MVHVKLGIDMRKMSFLSCHEHGTNHCFMLFSVSSDDPDILEWDEKSWRCADWVETAECKKVMGWEDCDDPAEFIYQDNPDLQQYR